MEFQELRNQIDRINLEILAMLNQRARVIQEIGKFKTQKGYDLFDPVRESEMLTRILENNQGPFPDFTIKALFKEVFKASFSLMEEEKKQQLLVSRKHKAEDTVVKVGELEIGGKEPVVVAGPCSVEGREMLDKIAAFLSSQGVKFLRGGAFKPRTSPYYFQGLRERGLELLKEIAQKYNLKIVTEILDVRDLEKVSAVADVLQIGARNMYNYELLKEVGKTQKPVLLKRGFMATLEEFLFSAEYIIGEGNSQIILCERGIRTFERWTRNTLDISAVPILKQESHLPVLVDISHSTGRKDIAEKVAKAALAAGADGIMLEVHNLPLVALSDGAQQLDFAEFESFMKAIRTVKNQ